MLKTPVLVWLPKLNSIGPGLYNTADVWVVITGGEIELWQSLSILENVTINDVLPLKAARRDTITNLKCFGTPAPKIQET